MFSLYGISGQDFRGTLEQLSKLPGMTASRHVRGIGREGEATLSHSLQPSLTSFVPTIERHPTGGHSGYASAGFESAIESYRSMLDLDQDRDPLYHAYQIMTHEVFTLTQEIAAATAWRGLLGQGVRQAPVLDDSGGVIGLVTERALLTTFNLERKQARTPLTHHVRDVMITPVICADPITDIRRIARAMIELDLPCVPVANENHALLGLVSRGDILRAVIADPPLSLWV
jgi:CBS domain-containing protein